MLDTLNGSIVFTTWDLYSGFHQVSVEAANTEKTASSIHGQHYELIRMPFGLCNAPAIFQRLVDNILMEIKGEEGLVYLDDIICSSCVEQRALRLSKVLQRLEETSLYVQVSKCNFTVTEVEYLGHIVSNTGIRPDPKNISAIVNYPRPKFVHDIRAFLSLVGTTIGLSNILPI